MTVRPEVTLPFFAGWWGTSLAFNLFIYAFIQLVIYHIVIEHLADVLKIFHATDSFSVKPTGAFSECF